MQTENAARVFGYWMCGWALVVLTVVVGAWWPGAAEARTADLPAVPLVPHIPEAPPSATARGVFYEAEWTVWVQTSPLWLASTADGQGELCSDDRATVTLLVADTPVVRWEHTFASTDTQSIACIPPQPIAVPVMPGTYQVQVWLDDLYPDTYGSQPYYLVGARLDAPEYAAETMVAAGAPPAASPPDTAATATPAATVTPVAVVPREAEGLGATWAWWWIVLPVAGLAGLPGWWLWRRRHTSVQACGLTGVLSLFDTETHAARTVVLTGEAQMMTIRRAPLAVTAVDPRPARSRARSATDAVPPLAHLLATEQGAVLQELLPEGAGDKVLLVPNQAYELADGLVMLRYREG